MLVKHTAESHSARSTVTAKSFVATSLTSVNVPTRDEDTSLWSNIVQ